MYGHRPLYASVKHSKKGRAESPARP
ncbi:hypothetical protein IL54_3482 [Sphingobium sp. ba1]|nr:hypothetical protein IL54_3482 [Sphingobium sp. ba1]